MKTVRPYPMAVITVKGERMADTGHPWIYDAEVMSLSKPSFDGTHYESCSSVENGSLVDAVSVKGKWLGCGFYNENSKIRIRLISHNANDVFNETFWMRRLQYAWDYRKAVMASPSDLKCCRLIFGDADTFPGLTVDRFGDVLVAQVLSLGIEKLKNTIFPLMIKMMRDNGQEIRGIYERNDAALRDKEGLPQNKGWYGSSDDEDRSFIPADLSTTVRISENNILYDVDFENGQKTGYFLDQKYNRQAVARVSAGRTVLDCFTHTGSFALNAAAGGASHVTAVDISAPAIEMAKHNAALNNMSDRIDFVVEDIFDLLVELEKQPSKYDLIILDPPAFAKSRRVTDSAMRGYKDINFRAMKILRRGGFLATCSCSHFAFDDLFIKMLKSSALSANVTLKQVEARQQACDHPILMNVDETNYLKFYVFQVV